MTSEEQNKFYVNLSGLLSKARLEKGFATLRELYRAKNPPIDYQTWVHAESGRRIPTATIVLKIADILEIDRESLIIAYCKDKFNDPLSEQILEAFQYKKYLNVDTLLEAKVHDRTEDYVFNGEQIKAIQSDIRLRLYLNYTYSPDMMTNFSRLANYFGVEKSEVKEVVDKLQLLGLVEVIGEEVKRIHRHTTLPNTSDLFLVRRQSLLKSVELSMKPSSYVANYHVNLSEKSYKKILAIFEFVEATLIKMEKEDSEQANIPRFQIAMIGSNINQGNEDDRG